MDHRWYIYRPASVTPTGGGGGGGDDGGSTSSGEVGTAPSGFSTLVFSATPTADDTTFDGYLTRTGMTKKFGESPSYPDNYGLATSDQTGIYPAMKILAHGATHGVNGGLLFPGMPGGTVSGGPRHAFTRAQIWWPTGYDFNPVWPDGSRVNAQGTSAGGIKAGGPWGGLTPSTGNVTSNIGFALRIWTGLSFNFISIGLDLQGRPPNTYSTVAVFRDASNNVWRVDANQGRWVQLEWETSIETTAGGHGSLKFWVDGVLGINLTNLTYFNPTNWVPDAGVKGFYFQNWWGGGGTAPTTTPNYYRNIELWKP